jgi:hypothetical protein
MVEVDVKLCNRLQKNVKKKEEENEQRNKKKEEERLKQVERRRENECSYSLYNQP